MIIGSGYAAVESIAAMRDSGFDGVIHMFSDSVWPVYNPMLTSYYSAGKISFDNLFPYGRGEEFAKKYDVIMHLGSPVIRLDTKTKSVSNENGEVVIFDNCLICSGAKPFVPYIDTEIKDVIYTMRSVEDALALEKIMEKLKKVLVVGASMVGVKIVELLTDAGCEVYFADLAPNIFPLAAHKNCSLEIEKRLNKKNIKLIFDNSIEKVRKGRNGVLVQMKNKDLVIEVDIIVMCIGVRPILSFVNKEQIVVDQGIVVDEHMRTSSDCVYAAGDVSQGKNLLTGQNQIIGLLANAKYQGRTAGRNMSGINDSFHGNVPHNITHFFDIDFVSIGEINSGDEVIEGKSGDKYAAFSLKEGRICGVNLLNLADVSGILKNYFIKRIEANLDVIPEHILTNSLVMNKVFTEYPWIKKMILEGK